MYVDVEIYEEMPEGFTVSGYVLRLRKALEGIKQGAHLWFNENRQALEIVGFKASLSEPNLYVHSEHPNIIAVFVDDILAGFAPEATDGYLHVKAEYAKLINIGNMDVHSVRKFTGVEVVRDREARTITLSQTGYTKKELALRYKGQYIESYSPTGPERAIQDKFRRLQVEAEGNHEQRIPTTTYLQVVGSILWPAIMTRPDIYSIPLLQISHFLPVRYRRTPALGILRRGISH